MDGATELRADSGESDVSYSWQATDGTFDTSTGDRVVWKAPGSVGQRVVTLTGTRAGTTKETAMTVTVKSSPVTIAGWELVDDLIGGKDASVTIRNDSSKTINALKVRMVMWNNFGERVTRLGDYVFHGIASDIAIEPGNSKTSTWSLYWATGVTQIIPWVYEVAFTDASVWKLED
ncbi:DUF5780 domain-containing protein [Microbacterium sp.]|uniref:DUF5780 domain-containing protein n=1 Tax=Microbacterium sp. TaxID=51671 RepID=UPI00273237D3|nr:DUF5780 domain-containing protein [Microbacterium sp.]